MDTCIENRLEEQLAVLNAELMELRKQVGGISPFPNADIDGFLSHFVLVVEFLKGPQRGQLRTITMPVAIQTVSRSSPFVYKGTDQNHSVSITLPQRSKLPRTISEADFFVRPTNFFQPGKEVVWMQILNLDARADTEVGPIRIILGETVMNEYPEFFRPSLGVAESLGERGFPARLFFNPVAILETNFGVFRATHGVLSYGRVIEFPPIGAAVTTNAVIPMEPLQQIIERRKGERQNIDPPMRIIALAHPIDVPMQITGYDSYGAVQEQIVGAPKVKRLPERGLDEPPQRSKRRRK